MENEAKMNHQPSEMELKHLKENNTLAFPGLFIVEIIALAAAIMFKDQRDVPLLPILIFLIIGAAFMLFGRFAHGSDEKGHLFMFIGIGITFCTSLWTSINTPYLYAFTFLICFVVMLYRDLKICILGCSVAAIGNVVLTVLVFMKGDPAVRLQVITNDIFVIACIILAIMIVKLMGEQSDEVMDKVKKEAANAEANANRIRETAEQIKGLLENANISVEDLSSAIDKSATSTQQISDSTLLTAESIQTQTEMASNITEALQTVSDNVDAMTREGESAMDIVNEGNRTVENLKQQAELVATINGETADMTKQLQEKA